MQLLSSQRELFKKIARFQIRASTILCDSRKMIFGNIQTHPLSELSNKTILVIRVFRKILEKQEELKSDNYLVHSKKWMPSRFCGNWAKIEYVAHIYDLQLISTGAMRPFAIL